MGKYTTNKNSSGSGSTGEKFELQPNTRVVNPWTGEITTWKKLQEYINKNIKKDPEKVRALQAELEMPKPGASSLYSKYGLLKDKLPKQGYTGKWGKNTENALKTYITSNLQAERPGTVVLHGGFHNKKYFDTWANKIAGGSWTRQQVYQLQVELGFKNPTGVYDPKTKTAHWKYLQERTASPNVAANKLAGITAGAAQDISYLPNLRDPSHPIAMSSEQAEIENAIRQGREQRNAIQKDMLDTWKDISGVTASQANVNWATEKVLQGWGYDDFYFWMKDRPEMKQMYPGMPNGMLPSEYTSMAQMLNQKYLTTAGRPLTRKEIANMMKGGDFPEDDFYIGQPVFRDEG